MCPDSDIFLPIDLNPGTRPVRSVKSCGSLTFCILMTDLRQFLCTQEIKTRFLPWLENHFEDLVDHEVPACRKKVLIRTCPKSFIYSDYGNLYIFEELYKNEL